GGATKQRHKFGYTVEQMGEVRFREMQCVEKVLGLTGMTVLDLPDSGLKEMDPREIEAVVREHILTIKPNILVTYPVHGISGFHDHIVTHAVVKRLFNELRDAEPYLKRLAFETVTEEEAKLFTHFHLNGSKPEEIDCVMTVDDKDIEAGHRALDCYESYKETIENSRIKEYIRHKVMFEIYREIHKPPVDDLCAGLE
ncbi:PIG-L family deacetylase, partial [candidate division KSB1 bacterium]